MNAIVSDANYLIDCQKQGPNTQHDNEYTYHNHQRLGLQFPAEESGKWGRKSSADHQPRNDLPAAHPNQGDEGSGPGQGNKEFGQVYGPYGKARVMPFAQ